MAEPTKVSIEEFNKTYWMWLTEMLLTHGDQYFSVAKAGPLISTAIARQHVKYPPAPMRYNTKEKRYEVFGPERAKDEVCISRTGKEFIKLNRNE